MKNLPVRHYLDIYRTRKEMQDKGITKPGKQMKKCTTSFVTQLKGMPLDEEIMLKGNSFFDSKGKLIMKMPD